MNTAKTGKKRQAHYVAKFGRVKVPVYRRRTPQGNFAFMVANYVEGKRRFDSYSTAAEAMKEARKLAKQLNNRDVISASMTREQSIDYASAVQTLEPFGLSLAPSIATLGEALKIVGDLPGVLAAAKFYREHNKQITPKLVADVVTDLLSLKETRKASKRYVSDLRGRLTKFSTDCKCNIGNVTSAFIQDWLDSQKLSTQTYENNRRVLHLLFKFAVNRGYALDNPVVGVEQVKVKNRATKIYTPVEIARLLNAASPEFLPALAIGAFSGLRSAEIERLEWSDIDLVGRHITVGADKAKTASRRNVPIHENLAGWLATYASRKGKVWTGGWLYKAQHDTAAATKVEADEGKGIKGQDAVLWKQNALRHSYVSYRLAEIQNASQVALECGNSAQMIFGHYHQLVKPGDAERWFGIKPEGDEANVHAHVSASQTLIPFQAAHSKFRAVYAIGVD